ncbi:hypothetical protein B0H14DRAFT_2655656 [Mycena olivaceomarginata]|nr:hypothetical protein B0H14DRAFT_2655656 [Mycena olivaceomarginata]
MPRSAYSTCAPKKPDKIIAKGKFKGHDPAPLHETAHSQLQQYCCTGKPIIHACCTWCLLSLEIMKTAASIFSTEKKSPPWAETFNQAGQQMSPTEAKVAKLIGLLVLGGKAQFPSELLQRNEPFEDSGRVG